MPSVPFLNSFSRSPVQLRKTGSRLLHLSCANSPCRSIAGTPAILLHCFCRRPPPLVVAVGRRSWFSALYLKRQVPGWCCNGTESGRRGQNEMGPKQATLGYVKSGQTTLGLVIAPAARLTYYYYYYDYYYYLFFNFVRLLGGV